MLGDLVEAYEDVHVPIGPVSDADMLQSCLDDWRITQAEVAKKTRIAESTISEVLSRQAASSNRAQIGKLARYFKIAARGVRGTNTSGLTSSQIAKTLSSFRRGSSP